MSISYSQPKQNNGANILRNEIIYNGVPSTGFMYFSFGYNVGYIDDNFDMLYFSLEDGNNSHYCGSMIYDI